MGSGRRRSGVRGSLVGQNGQQACTEMRQMRLLCSQQQYSTIQARIRPELSTAAATTSYNCNRTPKMGTLCKPSWAGKGSTVKSALCEPVNLQRTRHVPGGQLQMRQHSSVLHPPPPPYMMHVSQHPVSPQLMMTCITDSSRLLAVFTRVATALPIVSRGQKSCFRQLRVGCGCGCCYRYICTCTRRTAGNAPSLQARS